MTLVLAYHNAGLIVPKYMIKDVRLPFLYMK